MKEAGNTSSSSGGAITALQLLFSKQVPKTYERRRGRNLVGAAEIFGAPARSRRPRRLKRMLRDKNETDDDPLETCD